MHKREVTEKDGIIIRCAKLADAEILSELAADLAMQESQVPHTTIATLKRDVFCEKPECFMMVAEEASRIVGFVMFYSGYDLASASAGYHLGDIVVKPQKRGRGIGTLLMQSLAQQALADNKLWMSWTVSRTNENARKFYSDVIKASQIDVEFMAVGISALRRLSGV
jgi:ribosomal protein S18 acetylase RimI-like enzyme